MLYKSVMVARGSTPSINTNLEDAGSHTKAECFAHDYVIPN